MKKLIAIVITFIFIFGCAGYCTQDSIYYKTSLRVPVYFANQKDEIKTNVPVETWDLGDMPDAYKKGRVLVKSINALLATNVPEYKDYPECAQILKAGVSIFSDPRYLVYLNKEGLKIKEGLESMLRDSEKAGFIWDAENFNRFKNLIARIPTVENPNEDLFVDVLSDLTPEQIYILAHAGTGDNFHLQLTKGCTNQCLTCGLSKTKGALRHMPFPIAIKIMRKIVEIQKSLLPYFDSEPFDYEDQVIGADITDIVNLAKKIGFNNIVIVTHGLGGSRAQRAEAIATKLTVPLEISFHAYHTSVATYAKSRFYNRLSEERAARIRESVIDEQVKRYVSLMRGVINSGQYFRIRKYDPDPDIETILEQYKLAHSVISEIQAIQGEIWERVKRTIGEEIFNKLEEEKRIEKGSMLWIGDAAVFLRDLNVPGHAIMAMQEKYKALYSEDPAIMVTDYSLYVWTDGALAVQLSEGLGTRFRTAGDMFKSYLSPEFKVFLKFLKASLRMREFYVLPQEIDKSFCDFLIREIPGDLQDRYAGEEINRIKFDIPRYGGINYFRFLLNFYFSKDLQNLALLLNDSSDENLKALYDRLKDVPLPTRTLCEIEFWAQKNQVSYEYELMASDSPVSERDIYHSVRSLELPTKAFSAAIAYQEGVRGADFIALRQQL